MPRPTAYCLRKRWNSNGPLYQPGSNAAAPAEESGENKSSEAESLEAQTAEGPTAETQSSGPQPAEAKNGQLWTADVENDQVLDAALHAAAAESTRPEYDVSEEDSIAAEHPSLRQFPQDDSPGMRRRPRVTVEPRPKRIVYIGNLFYDVTAQDLKKHMEQFGVVTDIQLVYDKRGLSKG